MFGTYAEKNNDVLAQEEWLEQFTRLNIYWIDLNGTRYSDDGEGQLVSDDGDTLDYFRQFDGESFEYFLKDELDIEECSMLQHRWDTMDLEAVLNGGNAPSDYISVKLLDIMYDGEI